MKKLFTSLLALAFALGVIAQTDVTSTYLTNPSFELGTDGTAASTGKGFYTPYGWKSDFPTSGTHNFEIASASSTTNTSSSGFGVGTTPADGTYFFLGRHSWSTSLTANLSQETSTELPAGTYVISASYKIATKLAGTDGNLTISVKDASSNTLGSGVSVTSKTYNDSAFIDSQESWSKVAAVFTVSTAGKVTINLAMNFNPKAVNTQQEAILIDDVRLYDLSKASETDPADLTGLIVNQDFNLYSGGESGWTTTTKAQNSAMATNQTGAFSGRFWENWNPSAYTGKMYQTLSSLPNGNYKVGLCAFVNTVGTEGSQYIYAGSAKTNVTSTTPTAYTTDVVAVTDGTLEIGFEQDESKANWCGIDNAKLYYCGPNYSAYVTALAGQVTKGKALQSSKMKSTVSSALSTAITTYETKTESSAYSTEAEWAAAVTAMTTAVTNAQTSVDNYTTAKTYLEAASSLDSAGQASYKANETVAALQTAYDEGSLEAVTATQVTALGEALRTAAKAQTTDGADMTLAIVNPEINGSDGWTTEKPNGGNGPLLQNTSFEYWGGSATGGTSGGSFDYYQEITGLPKGKYTVSADMYNSTNGESGATFSATSGVYATSGGTTISKLVDEDGTALKEYTTDEITVTNGTLRIGVKNTTTMTARWFVADNFKLTFVSAVAIDDYYTNINTLITTANAITGTMSETTSTALKTAVTNGQAAVSDKETDIEKLQGYITALDNAIIAANASVASNATVASGTISTSSVEGWTCTNSNTFHVNTWSVEGNSDGSNMTTPFIENWIASGGTLGGGKIYYTLSGLVAGTYKVSALVRVLNESGGSVTGASFYVNDATDAITTDNGASACTHGVYKNVALTATVDDGGNIVLGFNIASPTFNWISFKDVTVTQIYDYTLSETAAAGEEGSVGYLVSKYAGKTVDVSFTRNFTNDVTATVCLPFEATIPTGGKFYTFSGVSEDYTTVTMTETTASTLTAGTPYIFKPSATGGVTFTGTIASVASSYAPTDVTNGDWAFTGTYTKVVYGSDYSAGDYDAVYGYVAAVTAGVTSSEVEVGDFVNITIPGTSNTPAFRAVMKHKASTSAKSRTGVSSQALPSSLKVVLIDADGTATAIGTINVEKAGDGAWYTINGLKLQNEPAAKGIYIHNGKKVLVK